MKTVTIVGSCILSASWLALGFCQEQAPVEQKPPRGTFVSPVDEIDPTLVKPWKDHKDAIAKASQEMRDAFVGRLQEVRAKGDPAAVQKLEAEVELFDQQGILPADAAPNPDVLKAAMAFRKANATLMKAYRDAISTYTQVGDDEKALALRDQKGGLEAELGFPPIPNVPEPVFDGKSWVGWGQGWGGGKHQVVASDQAVRLSAGMYFAHERPLRGDCAVEAEVSNRVWLFKEPPGSVFQIGIQTDKGGCVVRIPARNASGQPIAGEGEVIHHDPAANIDRKLGQFPMPRTAHKKFRAIQIKRVGNTFSVSIDGELVVPGVPMPEALLGDCNFHIGILYGEADFKKLEVTQLVK
jgi:hypothetical protein